MGSSEQSNGRAHSFPRVAPTRNLLRTQVHQPVEPSREGAGIGPRQVRILPRFPHGAHRLSHHSGREGGGINRRRLSHPVQAVLPGDSFASRFSRPQAGHNYGTSARSTACRGKQRQSEVCHRLRGSPCSDLLHHETRRQSRPGVSRRAPSGGAFYHRRHRPH